ncbi:MAG: thermostable hemolysin delta-VPH [Erysipelotrichaceae bacterium]
MTYFNYHGQAKYLIKTGHLTHYEFKDQWNQIKPALVLYFDNHFPMPIREEKWSEYLKLL